MGRRAKLYRCYDCQHRQKVHWVERTRVSRPRCSACGSLTLLPDTAGAKQELQREIAIAAEQRPLAPHIKDLRRR